MKKQTFTTGHWVFFGIWALLCVVLFWIGLGGELPSWPEPEVPTPQLNVAILDVRGFFEADLQGIETVVLYWFK